MSLCGVGQGCDLSRSEVLQNCARDSWCCDVGNNVHKQVAVSSLLSKVIPMSSTHAEVTRG